MIRKHKESYSRPEELNRMWPWLTTDQLTPIFEHLTSQFQNHFPSDLEDVRILLKHFQYIFFFKHFQYIFFFLLLGGYRQYK